jgi:DNA replication and repair protein RecF
MIVRELSLHNFRNHRESSASFGEGMNAVLGDNGQGKTNVLEAVSYLGLTKSFYASSDADVLTVGADLFRVEGSMESDGGLTSSVQVSYRRDPPEKQITVNGAKPESYGSMIGRFPVVVLSPEHSRITSGGPVERRKFIDLTLSQVSAAYLDDLFAYRRALRQRNHLLAEARAGVSGVAQMLEPWTGQLALSGGRILARRLIFAKEFAAYVLNAYASLAESPEVPTLDYEPVTGAMPGMSADDCASLLLDATRKRQSEEMRRGTSVVGPHRDEIKLLLDGMDVQRFASQGQHKTLLVALKLAEHQYVIERRNERPMFLLDDLFSELDAVRSARILERIRFVGQTIITTTEESPFRGTVEWNGHNRKFRVRHGTITPA